jgi:hypothetical protein
LSETNYSQLLQALNELGGSATVKELNVYLWDHHFQREGRNWSEHFVQHDLHYAMKRGLVTAMNEGRRYRYYLPQQVLTK